MKIAIAQLNYTVGDIDGNTSKIIDSITRAKGLGADLVLFAEQAVSGTPAFDLLRKTTFLELCEDALVQIASCCDDIAAIVGLPILTAEGTISAAALIQDRKVLRYVGKKYITARREMGFVVPSKGYEYVTIKGHKCAIVVGDDLRRIHDCDSSVETILSINARRYGRGTMTRRYEMMRDLAFVEGKNLVMANQVGGNTEIVYDGTSGAINRRGELCLMMKSFEEDLAVFDTEAPAAPVAVPSSGDRTRLVYEAAVCGLRDFYLKNGYTKAAVGLSGGIDSAVTACLAVAALGRTNVRALLMPSHFSSDHSVEDAKVVAEALGIEYNVIPINEIYTSVVDTLKPVTGGTEFDSTEENIQTRIRTVLLMALQNKTGYVLLNSSNKSENALGLCTLYGDTAGAFSPTGDLYKSEMYDLARYINRTLGDPIPESVLRKEPSSELRHPLPHDRGGAAPRGDRQCGLRLGGGGEDPFDDHAQREETLPVPARAASFDLCVRARTPHAADQPLRRLAAAGLRSEFCRRSLRRLCLLRRSGRRGAIAEPGGTKGRSGQTEQRADRMDGADRAGRRCGSQPDMTER